ncbi:hypothetical protein DFH07DRAFT_781962 [Mycena maculata]|uniref:Uncharacterized protein n=1 Tax=Mycena maculata TaxID=230809 RepID=A0AAD7MRY6_9AGAR|nr:hypothetical protein DFH07DRAFT_781962 [Mycena maculata]
MAFAMALVNFPRLFPLFYSCTAAHRNSDQGNSLENQYAPWWPIFSGLSIGNVLDRLPPHPFISEEDFWENWMKTAAPVTSVTSFRLKMMGDPRNMSLDFGRCKYALMMFCLVLKTDWTRKDLRLLECVENCYWYPELRVLAYYIAHYSTVSLQWVTTAEEEGETSMKWGQKSESNIKDAFRTNSVPETNCSRSATHSGTQIPNAIEWVM